MEKGKGEGKDEGGNNEGVKMQRERLGSKQRG